MSSLFNRMIPSGTNEGETWEEIQAEEVPEDIEWKENEQVDNTMSFIGYYNGIFYMFTTEEGYFDCAACGRIVAEGMESIGEVNHKDQVVCPVCSPTTPRMKE